MVDAFTIGVAISGILVFFGFVIAYFSMRVFEASNVSRRIDDFVLPEDQNLDQQQDFLTIPERLQGSIITRTIVPRIRAVIVFLGNFAPKRTNAEINRKLSIAGNPFGMHALEFNGIKLVFLILGLILALLFIFTDVVKNNLKYLVGLGILFISFLSPDVWLDYKVRQIKDQIRRGFPDALDMLSVCAFAGLGFDQALQRVSESLRTPLGFELRRTVQEMELGVTRAEALRNLSDRLDITELSSFVAIIIQAENLGMRIADVLHTQAEQMRILKQYRAKEAANRLPAKMLFPLALFILPALFAVIFAPVVPSLISLLGNF